MLIMPEAMKVLFLSNVMPSRRKALNDPWSSSGALIKVHSEKLTVLNVAEFMDNASTDNLTVAEVRIKVDVVNEVSEIERSLMVREFEMAWSAFLKMKKFDWVIEDELILKPRISMLAAL